MRSMSIKIVLVGVADDPGIFHHAHPMNAAQARIGSGDFGQGFAATKHHIADRTRDELRLRLNQHHLNHSPVRKDECAFM